MALEDVQSITQGAEIFANLRNQGLSQESAEEVVVNSLRDAQRQKYQERNMREGNRAAALEYLAQNDAEYDFTQERTLDAARMGEYGQTESDFQIQSSDDKNIEGRDQRRLRQQVETNTDKLIRAQIVNEKGKREEVSGIAKANQPIPEELREAAMLQDLGLAYPPRKETVTPKKRKDGVSVTRYGRKDPDDPTGKRELEFRIGSDSVRPNEFAKVASGSAVKDAFQRLDQGIKNGTVDPDAVVNSGSGSPKTARQLLGELAEEINPGLRIEREKGMTANMVIADQARVRDGAKEETLASLRQERADIIRNKSGYDRERAIAALSNLEAIPTNEVTSQAVALKHLTGDIAGYTDPQGNLLGEPNTSALDNQLNAPQPTRAQAFALGNAQMNVSSPGNFGAADVNMMDPGRRFMQAAAQIADVSGLPSDIRSLEEFDNVISAVIDQSATSGREFYQNQGGKQIRVSTPGVDDVLTAMRFTSGERTQLANALVQMEQLRTSGINQGLKDDFQARTSVGPARADRDVTFNPESMRGPGDGMFEKVNNEKIKGKSVGAALRGISDEKSIREMEKGGNMYTEGPDGKQVLLPEARDQIAGAREARKGARISLQGVPAGEKAPRAAFIKQKGRDMSPAERSAAYGPENAAIMNELVDRYESDEAKRSAAPPPANPAGPFDTQGSDPVMQSWRDADAAGQKRMLESRQRGENAEVGELVKLAKYGRRYPAEVGTPNAEATRAGQGATSNAASFPNGYPSKLEVPNNIQRIEQAPVPESIAPQPGASTGNQGMPNADAGRGGPMPQSMRDELNSLGSNNYTFMSKPDMQDRGSSRQQIIDKLNTPRNRRIGYGAAAAGGIAGLASLISGEREEREEEAMYR